METIADLGRAGEPSSMATALALSIPRGGASDLVFPITWVQGILNEAIMGPIVKPLATFIARFIIIMFVTAEIMAYLGWIGERGEGLYEWASDRKLGSKPE